MDSLSVSYKLKETTSDNDARTVIQEDNSGNQSSLMINLQTAEKSDKSVSVEERDRRRKRSKEPKTKKKSRKHKHKHKTKERERDRRSRKHRSRSWSSSSSSSSWSSSDSSSSISEHRPAKIKLTSSSSAAAAAVQDQINGQSVQLPQNIAEEEEDADDDAYGPVAPFAHESAKLDPSLAHKGYGSNLLAGEGDALAEFVKRNERIPRRGEVGWDGEKIKQLEDLGYVMSGSRHKRMEAVRKRKENQIITAEGKRLMIINEKRKTMEKEAKVLEEMRHLIKKKEHEEAAERL